MFMVGPMMHRILSQFLNRENDREALKTILNCIRIINAIISIGIDATGNIKLYSFMTGTLGIIALPISLLLFKPVAVHGFHELPSDGIA